MEFLPFPDEPHKASQTKYLKPSFQDRLAKAILEWKIHLGENSVLTGKDACQAYAQDTTGATRLIEVALHISDACTLPEVMHIASRNHIAVYPISTGHNWGYGTALPVEEGCVILDLSRLNKIIHFDAELGVVTVEPGVTQGALNAFLEAGKHDYLVPVTGGGPSCSLVGNALERGFGITPHTDHWLSVTDIEAVTMDGNLFRTALREAGGEDLARLFKWGIGPYSAGLFTQGGFGVVTRMSIVLARRPPCIKACFFSIESDELIEPAIENIRTMLRLFPGIVGGINLMNRHRVLAMTVPYPRAQLDLNGVIPEEVIKNLGEQYGIGAWTGLITLYGTSGTVNAAYKEIKAAMKPITSRFIVLTAAKAVFLSKLTSVVPGALGKRLKRQIRTVTNALELVNGKPNETALPLAYWLHRKPLQSGPYNPARDGCGLIWYAPLVPMRPQQAKRYIEFVMKVCSKHRIEPLVTLTSMNDRLFCSTVPLLFDGRSPSALLRATACYEELLEVGRNLGYFPYRFSISSMPKLSALQSHSKVFQECLKSAVDPHNLLSPGRYQ